MELVLNDLMMIHVGLSLLLFIPPLVNLCALFFKKTHTQKMKYMAVVAPAYYTLLSASLFSGLVMWAAITFLLSFKIVAMVVLWLFVFVFEIKRHKRQKLMRVEANECNREHFFRLATIKYVFDICAFIFLGII